MRKQESQNLSDDEGTVMVTCTQHAGIPAMRLLARLGKLVGPAAGALGNLATLAAAIIERLDEDSVESLICQVLSESQVAVVGVGVKALNSAANINDVFSGRLLLLSRTLAFALEVNYGDFWEGVTEALAAMAPKDPGPAAASPST